MEIGFVELSSCLVGFLFGLLVSWTTRLHQPPESELVKDMLKRLDIMKKKRPSTSMSSTITTLD